MAAAAAVAIDASGDRKGERSSLGIEQRERGENQQRAGKQGCIRKAGEAKCEPREMQPEIGIIILPWPRGCGICLSLLLSLCVCV
jgi:hypothetical protein